MGWRRPSDLATLLARAALRGPITDMTISASTFAEQPHTSFNVLAPVRLPSRTF